jgi:hypothetical protein
MSGNIDTTNNINNVNGVVNSIGLGSGDDNASDSSVQNVRSFINNLTNSLNTNDDSFVSQSYVSRGNNRRYSYGGVRQNGAEGAGAVSDGVDSGNFVSQSYVTRGNVRRYSYANIRRNGAEGADAVSDGVGGFVSNSYVGRANNRRYSYARIREDGADQAGTANGRDGYKTNLRYDANQKKEAARTRSMTAKDNLFKKQDNNRYTYGSYVSGGQQMTRDSALDSLFYSDVANAMIDNGFALTRTQRLDIQDFNHDFSDAFAAFNFVDSDLLYQQAAIVDGLLNNGAFLTPEQEISLGIDGGISNS